jgi:hypothetical protein
VSTVARSRTFAHHSVGVKRRRHGRTMRKDALSVACQMTGRRSKASAGEATGQITASPVLRGRQR